jgi:hypothetical protein
MNLLCISPHGVFDTMATAEVALTMPLPMKSIPVKAMRRMYSVLVNGVLYDAWRALGWFMYLQEAPDMYGPSPP